ncbi:MAG: response regulator [Thermodesulfobacteriota bacterium]
MVKKIKKILIVDDEIQIVKAIERHLSRTGFTVGSADTIKEAREKIDKEARNHAPFDLLITDVMMPSGSGIDLSQWLKKSYPDISVLFISGYGVKDLVTDAVDLTLDDFCQKPFTPSKLLATIHCIDQRRQKRNLVPGKGQ